MQTYKYTDGANTVVHVIEEDGKSYSSCLASVLPEGTEILPADPPPVIIPASVTMRQARLALLQAGKLDAVDAAIASMTGTAGAEAQIAWEFSSMVERLQPLVLSIGAGLNMTEQEIDDLFLLASTL